MLKKFFMMGALLVLGIVLHVFHKKNNCEAYFNGNKYQCSFGRSGVSLNKKEGDGATPVGDFPLRQVFYRADRLTQLKTALPTTILQKNMGWCDDVRSPFYNKQIQIPDAFSHENLWLNDHVYDVIVVVGYNDQPVEKGKGSAIFMHVAREGYTPTAGCIAFSEKDLVNILKEVNVTTRVKIEKSGRVTLYNS